MSKMTEEEKWLPVPGYEPFYEASNLGGVRSLERTVFNPYVNKHYLKAGRLLKPGISRGYYTVNLTDGIKTVNKAVHLIIWDTFGDKPRDGHRLQVDHINSIRTDNKISNLQLLTNRENSTKAVVQGGKSLPVGVSATKRGYQASIRINGDTVYLGIYKSLNDASGAYQLKLSEIKPEGKCIY